jgi:hypothetical protein
MNDMKNRRLVFTMMLLAFGALMASAADAPSFAGEYADRKFLGGQAVFQMSLEQSGGTVTVWFSAGYNDGRGTAPEASGSGKVTSKGTVDFTFKDSDGNAGAGTITRAANDIVVSLKATKVADNRGLVFYRDGIRLTRQTKK